MFNFTLSRIKLYKKLSDFLGVLYTAIKAYLIPYISDVLGVPEQFLFEENENVRMKMIRYICQDLSAEEENYLLTTLNNDKNIDSQNEILKLIKYAPEPLLSKMEKSLLNIKKITQAF